MLVAVLVLGLALPLPPPLVSAVLGEVRPVTSPTAAVCQFCPADERVPATRTYADPHGYVYRMCQRHFRPVGQWLEKRRKGEEGRT